MVIISGNKSMLTKKTKRGKLTRKAELLESPRFYCFKSIATLKKFQCLKDHRCYHSEEFKTVAENIERAFTMDCAALYPKKKY